MRLLAQWIAARAQWAWCVVWGHLLTVPHRAGRNDRYGNRAMESWMSCRCGKRVGMIVRALH